MGGARLGALPDEVGRGGGGADGSTWVKLGLAAGDFLSLRLSMSHGDFESLLFLSLSLEPLDSLAILRRRVR